MPQVLVMSNTCVVPPTWGPGVGLHIPEGMLRCGAVPGIAGLHATAPVIHCLFHHTQSAPSFGMLYDLCLIFRHFDV
jgi:hypothetical protein